MVISNKPLRFIIATLVACLPLMSFANPEQDSVKVKQKLPKAAEGAHAEPTDVKSKLKNLCHHLLDSHDFFLVSANEETGITFFITNNSLG
jgi:F-type H+-transporting ATPase subunit a